MGEGCGVEDDSAGSEAVKRDSVYEQGSSEMHDRGHRRAEH